MRTLDFYALEDNCTVTLTQKGTVSWTGYYVDVNSEEIIQYTLGTALTLPSSGDSVSFTNGQFSACPSNTNYLQFVITGKVMVCGSTMGLIDGNDDTVTALPYSYCFNNLFRDCSSIEYLVDKGSFLPATTLQTECYRYMFKGCTNLKVLNGYDPSEIGKLILPATTLTDYCYYSMFYGCTSLQYPPELPATTLTDYCYYSMFCGCTGLTQVPELPATTLTDYCYYSMFCGCTSLTKAPKLPATTLANSCYWNMFYKCTSLTQVPELPATTLANQCYYYMFQLCANIKLSTTTTDYYNTEYRIPSSGTGTAGTNSLTGMFNATGGTFTGTPTINTTYYIHKDSEVTELPVNKVVLNDEVLIDLTEDTTAPEMILEGYTAYDKTATLITGTAKMLSPTDSEAITPTVESQTIVPDEGYSGFTKVVIDQIPRSTTANDAGGLTYNIMGD